MEVLNVQSTWYPMRLSSIYREKIWGGTQIPRLRGEFSDRCIGESWDIACRSDSDNRVANGRFAGELFRTLAKRQGKALLGDGWSAASFPLLVKLIDAREPLSVQVHPDDGYAGRVEGCSGKTEMWYVLDAQPGACLIAGVRSCTKAELRDAVLTGRAEQYLNRIEVHRGDSITIPSGMVHALGAGCLVVEIQQNSDVTYRLFDYGRPRELQLERAMDVVDLGLQPAVDSAGGDDEANRALPLCHNAHFRVDRVNVRGRWRLPAGTGSFRTVTCVGGTGLLTGGSGSERLAKGDSLFLPAALEGCRVDGACTLLITTPQFVDGGTGA